MNGRPTAPQQCISGCRFGKPHQAGILTTNMGLNFTETIQLFNTAKTKYILAIGTEP